MYTLIHSQAHRETHTDIHTQDINPLRRRTHTHKFTATQKGFHTQTHTGHQPRKTQAWYTHTHTDCHKRGFDMSSLVFYHLLPKRPSQKGTSTFIEGFVCRENCVDFSPASWLRENTLTAIKSANLHSKMAIGGVLDASQSYTRQPAHMQKSSSSHRIVFRGFGTYYLIMLLLPSQSSLMGLWALVNTEQEPRHQTHVNSAEIGQHSLEPVKKIFM